MITQLSLGLIMAKERVSTTLQIITMLTRKINITMIIRTRITIKIIKLKRTSKVMTISLLRIKVTQVKSVKTSNKIQLQEQQMLDKNSQQEDKTPKPILEN